LKEDPEHKTFGVRLNLKVCEAYNHINKGAFLRHSNAISTPFSRHFNAISGAEAIPACNRVIEIEQNNVEAYIARHESKKLEEDFQGSLQDIQEVLCTTSPTALYRTVNPNPNPNRRGGTERTTVRSTRRSTRCA